MPGCAKGYFLAKAHMGTEMCILVLEDGLVSVCLQLSRRVRHLIVYLTIRAWPDHSIQRVRNNDDCASKPRFGHLGARSGRETDLFPI